MEMLLFPYLSFFIKMNEQEFMETYEDYIDHSKRYNEYSRQLYKYKQFNDKIGRFSYKISKHIPFYNKFEHFTSKWLEKIVGKSFLDEVSKNYGDSFSLYIYENLDTINLGLYKMKKLIDLKMDNKKEAYILMKRFNKCVERLDSLPYFVNDSSKLERVVMEVKKDSRNYEIKRFPLEFTGGFLIGLISAYILTSGVGRLFKKRFKRDNR